LTKAIFCAIVILNKRLFYMYQQDKIPLQLILNKDYPAKYANDQGISIDSTKFSEQLAVLDNLLKSIGIKYAFVDENTYNVAYMQSWRVINVSLNNYLNTMDLDSLDPDGEKMNRFYDIIEKYEAENAKVNRFNIASLLENIDPSIQSVFSILQESIIPVENRESDLISVTQIYDTSQPLKIPNNRIIEPSETETDHLDPEVETVKETDILQENGKIKPIGPNEMLHQKIAEKTAELKLLIDKLLDNPAEFFEFKSLTIEDTNCSMSWLVSKENAQAIKLINQFIDLYIANTPGNTNDPEEKSLRKLCLDIRGKQKEVNKLAISLIELNNSFIWHMIKRTGGGVDIGKSNDPVFEQPFGSTILNYQDIYWIAYMQFYKSIFNKATAGPYKDYKVLSFVGSSLRLLTREMTQNASLIRLPVHEVAKQSKFRKSELEVLQAHPTIQKNSDEYYTLIIEAMDSKKSKSNTDIIDIKYIRQI
jgi:hypothetical protein